MSRTQPSTRLQSPAQAIISFSGKFGQFSYKPENEFINIPLPFRFVVVDHGAHKIGGSKGLGDQAPKYKSNIAHENYSTALRITLGGKFFAEGAKWGDMPTEDYKLQGCKYVKLLYILTDLGQGKILACLQLKGRALSAWYECLKKDNTNPEGEVSFIVRSTVMMKGDKGEPSPVPVFEIDKISAETIKLAEEKDRELQVWFKSEFAVPLAAGTDTAESEDLGDEPAQQNSAAAAPPPPTQAAAPKPLPERTAGFVATLWEKPDRDQSMTYQEAVKQGFALMEKNYSPTNADRKATADLLFKYGLDKNIYAEHVYSGIDLEGTLVPLDLPF